MSNEAAIHRGTGFIANPAFFLIFFIAGSMGLAGLGTVGISSFWGWGLTAITAVLFGLAWVTGLGERLFVGVVALLGVASWFAVTWLLLIYWLPREPIWAIGLVLFNMAAPPAAILGEKVLPLLIAFVAGIAGVLSIIVFVMVIAGIGMAEH